MTDKRPNNETKQESRKRPRSHEAVRDSEEWLFTTLESVGDAVIATDAKGRIIFMNKVAVALTGWTEEDAEGRDCGDIFHIINETTRADSESPVTKVLRDGVISGLANHTILISKNGSECYIDDSGSPIRDKAGVLVGVVLIFRDVTGRRMVEKTLQERTEILQTLFDHIPVIVAFLDNNGQFKWVNREWARVTGWTLQAMQGQEMLSKFYPNPKHRQDASDYMQLAAPGWRDFQITVYDGTLLDISWASVRLADGTWIGIGQVVTERKLIEASEHKSRAIIEACNARLELAMRETTHRFKNNLQVISALIELQAGDEHEVVALEHLNHLRLHVHSLSQIHELMLENSRRDPLASGVSAKAALEKLVPLLQRTVGAQRIEFASDDVRLPANQGMSLAMLVNELVTNAVKHGGKQVGLRLTMAGGDVTLEVTDDGPGFVLPFDPATWNTGMQLIESLSRLELDGRINFSNRPQGGGQVRITFPAPESKVA